ncbi:hypothetical protein F0U61_20475 [Archangium violaceum]|uniref:hypothetical protein n=1 Tax=Archangium violaceum TaxID=83451 RepID=UPI002B2D9013|nr:hypothetical protein F0U61_20475 [Archangium violaceum]
MWKKTWLLGILMTATALSGCSSCGDNGGGGTDGGNTTADGGDGGGGNPDGSVDPTDPTLSSLTIEPTNPVLVVSGSTGVTQLFKVTGTFTDGRTEDVSGKALFSIDDTRLGLFGGGSGFTSSTTVGGTSTVRARVGTLSVSTPITVKLDQKVSDTPPPGQTPATPVPADPGSKFGGTVDTSYKPEIVYPNNGVLVPPNLGQLEIHIKPNNASTTLFELAFSNSITDVRVYLRCYLPSGFTLPSGVSRGCIYTPTENVWKFLAESNRGGQPVKLTVRSTDDSGTGKVGVSNPIAIQFARAELKGALYYWTTKTGSTGVMRYDFAGTGTTAASPVMLAKNIDGSVSCVGCHALSRNGKKLVAEVNGQNDGRLALADLSSFTADSKAKLGASRQSTFESWNPDGSKFVGVYGDSGATDFGLRIFNGDTGAYESSIPGTGDSNSPATHPDWSPDGQTIAYTSPTYKETNQRNYMGAIKMVTAKSGGGWNAPVTVVPAENGKHRYYPAIAPDNSFLVFNESACDSGTAPSHYSCNGDTDKTAKLWAAKLQAGATRVELTKANQGGVMDGSETKLTNSYPKWSPFVTRGTGDDKSRMMWVTFSSSRNYGLRTMAASSSSENDKSTLLWMAAVDPDKVNAGVDPSYPAFALPFQDITTSNHIAQWAQYFVSNGCSTVGEGCGSAGSTCCNGLQCVQLNQDPPIPCDVAGACVCDAIPQCAPALEKCSAAAPCCDGLLCLDDVTGGSCSGSDCSCKPPCASEGQACGSSACCDGLACVTESGSSTCQIILK